MIDTISYGIGEDYLKDWGYNEGLREIFQNFIDFGDYEINIVEEEDSLVRVSISNSYIPESLEFLQIGKSVKKEDVASIGKHGEGLKMALLVFLREEGDIIIDTGETTILPLWETSLIGKTFAITVLKREVNFDGFQIAFTCPRKIYYDFVNNIITKNDIIFDDVYHGSIVNKEAGNLYSGGLFVTKLPKLKKSYNIAPSRLELDRDRRIPSAFEVSWHTSKLNEKQLLAEEETAELHFVDQDYDDYAHISYVPTKLLDNIKVREVGGKATYVAKQVNKETKEEEEIIITNSSIKSYLDNQSIFQVAVSKLKNFIASKLGIKDLLINFRTKYCYSAEAKKDFDIILQRLGINLEKELRAKDELDF